MTFLKEEVNNKANGYALQCSCLEKPVDRGAGWVTVHGVSESDSTK